MDLESSPMYKSPQHECNVICGRGREAYDSQGNKRFRSIIQDHIQQYSEATSKVEKSCVVTDIMNAVRQQGDFVTRKGERVSERLAREKVGQGLRDALHTTYKSSTIFKKRRRNAEHNLQDQTIDQIIRENKEVTSIVSLVAKNMQYAKSDAQITEFFTAANERILEILKSSNSVQILEDARLTFAYNYEDDSDPEDTTGTRW